MIKTQSKKEQKSTYKITTNNTDPPVPHTAS